MGCWELAFLVLLLNRECDGLPYLWFLSLSFPGIALLPSWIADNYVYDNGDDDNDVNDDADDDDDDGDNDDDDDNDDNDNDDDNYDGDNVDDGGSSPKKGFLSHHFHPCHPCNGHWNTLF